MGLMIPQPKKHTGYAPANRIVNVSQSIWTAPADGIIMVYSGDKNTIVSIKQPYPSEGSVVIALVPNTTSNGWVQMPIPVFAGEKYYFSSQAAPEIWGVFIPYA